MSLTVAAEILVWLKVRCRVIEDLLKQLNDADGSGIKVPTENMESLLKDAERMVQEMEDRNFTPQKTAAEKERDEAKKRKMLQWIPPKPDHPRCWLEKKVTGQ